MTKTKALAILAAVAVAILVSALEKRRSVSAYCVGIIIEENETGEYCNFVTAKLEGEDNDMTVDIIHCEGDFNTALETIEQSDIRLFFPTVKIILIENNISAALLEKSISGMLALPSFPPDVVVVRAENPSELAEQEDVVTGLAGTLFIPKLVQDRNRKVSLVKFAEGQTTITPEVAYTDGRFYVTDMEEDDSSSPILFTQNGDISDE